MRRIARLSGLFFALFGVSIAAAQPKVTFIERQPDLSAGLGSIAIAAADLDGDGNIDLAVANFDSDDVSIFWGNGDGTFVSAAATLPVQAPSGTVAFESPVAIAIDYVTGQKYPDIITANESADTVSVIPNLGGRSFGAAIESPTGMSPEALVVGDFNGDGKLDVATPNFYDDSVSILLGNGGGTLASPQAITVGSEPYALAAADFNKDGKLDLIVANLSGGPSQTGSLMVLQGMGDGTFVAQPAINSDTFNDPVAITAAFGPLDLNGDSFPDVVVASDYGDSLAVLFGNGDLTFQSPITLNLSVGSMPEGVVVADFNGDGHPDIASSASFKDKISVFVGLGSGTFAAPQDFALAGGPSPSGIAAGDFNKDGKIDLATANTLQDGTGGASVFLNVTGVTLAASISPTDTAIPLTDARGFPASGAILIDQEQITYAGKQANSLTGAVRGANGTVAAAHAQGAAVVLAPPAVCVGDCNGDGAVTVDEILTMVNIDLGSVPISACTAGVANGDQVITVAEILTAVNNALNGCTA
ncbi:MAG: FG-GAP repeat domain-containing protein [Candidatus Binatia bacterium]